MISNIQTVTFYAGVMESKGILVGSRDGSLGSKKPRVSWGHTRTKMMDSEDPPVDQPLAVNTDLGQFENGHSPHKDTHALMLGKLAHSKQSGVSNLSKQQAQEASRPVVRSTSVDMMSRMRRIASNFGAPADSVFTKGLLSGRADNQTPASSLQAGKSLSFAASSSLGGRTNLSLASRDKTVLQNQASGLEPSGFRRRSFDNSSLKADMVNQEVREMIHKKTQDSMSKHRELESKAEIERLLLTSSKKYAQPIINTNKKTDPGDNLDRIFVELQEEQEREEREARRVKEQLEEKTRLERLEIQRIEQIKHAQAQPQPKPPAVIEQPKPARISPENENHGVQDEETGNGRPRDSRRSLNEFMDYLQSQTPNAADFELPAVPVDLRLELSHTNKSGSSAGPNSPDVSHIQVLEPEKEQPPVQRRSMLDDTEPNPAPGDALSVGMAESSIQPEHLSALERMDFEGKPRSRKSYFPDKVLQKVKPADAQDIRQRNSSPERGSSNYSILDDEGRLSDPTIFDLNINASKGTRLSELFGRFNDDTPRQAQIDEMPVYSQDLLKLKQIMDAAKNLEVQSLTNFQDDIKRESEDNRAIVPNFHDATGDKFQDTTKEVFGLTMLMCLDVSSRVGLVQKINEELAEKVAEMKNLLAQVRDIKTQPPKKQNQWNEERIFEKIAQANGMIDLRRTSPIGKEGILELVFSFSDMLLFNLQFEKVSDPTLKFLLKGGACKPNPLAIIGDTKGLNPLNKSEAVAGIFKKFIDLSCSVQNTSQRAEAHYFLNFLGKVFKRIDNARKSLNMCFTRHKISDASLNPKKCSITFMQMSRYTTVKFSLAVTVGLLAQNGLDLHVEVMSSSYKKKNEKEEICQHVDFRVGQIMQNISPEDPHWLLALVDGLAEILHEN